MVTFILKAVERMKTPVEVGREGARVLGFLWVEGITVAPSERVIIVGGGKLGCVVPTIFHRKEERSSFSSVSRSKGTIVAGKCGDDQSQSLYAIGRSGRLRRD